MAEDDDVVVEVVEEAEELLCWPAAVSLYKDSAQAPLRGQYISLVCIEEAYPQPVSPERQTELHCVSASFFEAGATVLSHQHSVPYDGAAKM